MTMSLRRVPLSIIGERRVLGAPLRCPFFRQMHAAYVGRDRAVEMARRDPAPSRKGVHPPDFSGDRAGAACAALRGRPVEGECD
jgi:hypothetical protein